MRLFAELRSSTAVVLVCLHLGIATLPLLCTCLREKTRDCHTREMVQQTSSHHDRETSATVTVVSCCSTPDTHPVSTTPTIIAIDQALVRVVSIAGDVRPSTEQWKHGLEAPRLLISTTPLFTLHSAFLI